MKSNNLFGAAFHFMPRVLSKKSEKEIRRGIDIVTQNNIIYFMNNDMPDTDTLYNINNAQDFEEQFSDNISGKISELDFKYEYDRTYKKRIIRKVPPDALYFTTLSDGEIKWVALLLTDVDGPISDENGTPRQSMIFTDSVGVWEDSDRMIIVESLNVNKDDSNVFQDMALVIQDSIDETLLT